MDKVIDKYGKDCGGIILDLTYDKCIECKNHKYENQMNELISNNYICDYCLIIFNKKYLQCKQCRILFNIFNNTYCELCRGGCKLYCGKCKNDNTMVFISAIDVIAEVISLIDIESEEEDNLNDAI